MNHSFFVWVGLPDRFEDIIEMLSINDCFYFQFLCTGDLADRSIKRVGSFEGAPIACDCRDRQTVVVVANAPSTRFA